MVRFLLTGGFPTPLKKICASPIGSFPEVGMNIKHIWNHHPVSDFRDLVAVFFCSKVMRDSTLREIFVDWWSAENICGRLGDMMHFFYTLRCTSVLKSAWHQDLSRLPSWNINPHFPFEQPWPLPKSSMYIQAYIKINSHVWHVGWPYSIRPTYGLAPSSRLLSWTYSFSETNSPACKTCVSFTGVQKFDDLKGKL